MKRKIKSILLFLSGIFSFVYFWGVVFLDSGLLSDRFVALFVSDLFIFSGGIFGGTSLYLTGTHWPYTIQGMLFIFGWFIIYKVFKIGYWTFREYQNKKPFPKNN